MNEIYFDNAATTRVDDGVAALSVEVMCKSYGNASSLHSKGLEAQLIMERARRQLMAAIGAKGGRLIFTSGGTEANNLALFGGAAARRRRGNKIITTAIEHSSVLDAARKLASEGFELIELKPGSSGFINAGELLDCCDEKTILVSVMTANNETGAIQPISDIARHIKRRSPHALLHTDAVQALGKTPLSASKSGFDLVTVSGHKIHAPKGVGALYIADKVRLEPRQFGGGQQEKLRPGTESTPLIAAFGLAAENSVSAMEQNAAAAAEIKRELLNGLKAFDNVVINSPDENCLPQLLNISVLGYRSETLLHFLEAEGIFVSSGSACSKGAQSHVLSAMGKGQREIDSALRLSFSKYNSTEQAKIFLEKLTIAIETLRRS